MDEIFTDQAFKGISFGITHAYTPTGIKKLDRVLGDRIRAYLRGEQHTEYSYRYDVKPPVKEVENIYNDTYESILDDIKNNPHLHQVIKDNLIFNLGAKPTNLCG